MLVIRRRAGESLLVGDSVELEILEVSQGHVKLGIRAPREILVLRKEVRVTADENRMASRGVSLESLSGLLGGLSQTSRSEDIQETRIPER